MGQLTNLYVSSSYQGLLKLTDSTTGLTATLQPVQDGLGGDSPLQISKTQVNISGSLTVNGSPITVDSGSLVTTASFNAYTSSNDSRVNSLISQTGSYVTETESGSFMITGSVAGDTLTFTKGNGSQFSLQVNTGSLPAGVVSGSAQVAAFGYATTSSVTSLSSSIATTDLNQNNIIAGLATTSSLTSLSSSIASTDLAQNNRLTSLEGVTGSINRNGLITTGSAGGNQSITGSLNVEGTISATSASFTYVNTVYETASVIYSSGSNQFGDASNDTQTLWGTVNLPSGPLSITGSVIATNFTGSLQGTSSYATQALSASYAPDTTNTGSLVSNVTNGANPNEAVVTVTKGDGTTSNFTINNVTNANSSSYSNYAVSSSQAQNAVTASYANDINRTGLITTGSASSVQSITGSVILSGSAGVELDVKGDQSNTGSLNVSGSVRVIGNQGNTGSLAVSSGSLNLVSQGSFGGYDIALTSGLGGQSNIIKGWGDNPSAGGAASLQGNYTGSLRITGSNNMVSMPLLRATGVGGGTDQQGYISGSDNTFATNGGGIYLNTGSLLFPKTTNNYVGANSAMLLNFTTSSLSGGHPTIQNNTLYAGTITINSNSGSISSLAGNIINGGGITSTQNFVTNTRPSISTNILGGAATLNHISSSINFNTNFSNSPITINNHLSSSIANNILQFTNNTVLGGFGGTGLGVWASGSQSSNNARLISDNLIGGRNINVSSSFVSSSNSNLVSTIIYGNGLVVSGSHLVNTGGGSAFFGRFNDTGSLNLAQDIVFAVGTGTAAANRRTSLHVTSGSLVGVSGSLDVKGNSVMTGSLTVSGSFGSINGIGDVILSGTTKMYETTGFPLQVFGTINSKRLHFNTNPFNSEPSSNLGALRFEGNNQQFYLTNYDIAQITTQSIVSTFVNTGSAYVETSLGSNNRGFDAYLKLTNAGGTGSLSTNVNTSITGSLSVSSLSEATGSFVITTNGTGQLTKSPYSGITSNLFSVGAFYSTEIQSGSSNVSQSINYNVSDISQGVSVVSGSRLTLVNSGTYNIQFSAQLLSDAGADDVWIWLKKNGTNVSDSAGRITLANNDELMAAWNYVVTGNAGDYFELVWQNTNGHAQIEYNSATGNIPAVPSIITTVTQVR